MAKFTPENKKKRIQDLIERLKNNLEVSSRDINLVLSPKEQKEMKLSWAQEKKKRDIKKPKQLKEYELLLKQAVMFYGRYEKYKNIPLGKKKDGVEEILRNKVIASLKKAQSFLLSLIIKHPELVNWLDRPITNENIIIDHTVLPRTITSRTNYKKVNIKERFEYKTISDVKIEFLEKAIINVNNEIDCWYKERGYVTELTEEQLKKLKEGLAKLRKDQKYDL